ncbi:MAG: carboxypeptidase regulatory-like domain-containing protein, partial [Chitinophagaceae bacterium]
MLKRILVLIALSFSVTTLMAQVTTSSITGNVKDDKGQPLTGATVTATHTPSGTQYTTIAGKDGSFYLPGCRVGGPYEVKINFTGLQPQTITGFNLLLGEPYVVNSTLSADVKELTSVVVSAGGRSKLSAGIKTGASTNITNRQLSTLPSVSRSLTDFTRLTPQSNGTAFGGRDGRYNNLQIDGANLNNNFGLSTDPLPGGGSNPISLDAIDEISVNIAPFDVRQANFTGAGINAVTRSGDNTFKGSAYGFYRDQSFNGRNVGKQKIPKFLSASTKIYGFRLGGPIIKNKLFFFINGEIEEKVFPSTTLRPAQPGVTGSIASATPKDSLAKLAGFLGSKGYDPGAYDNIPSFNSKNHKLLARIDWNISNNHRLTFKVSDFLSTTPNNSVIVNGTSIPGGGGSILNTGPAGGTTSITRLSNNRFSNNSYAFENSNYGFKDVVQSVSLELNSKFGKKISNQFIATATHIRDSRSYKGAFFPTIDFLNVPNGSNLGNANYMSVGMDPFTPYNDVKNNVFNVTDNFTYFAGKHTFTGGASYEYQTLGNRFMAGSNSYYLFQNLNDLITNKPPLIYALTYSLIPGQKTVYSANLKVGQLGIYGQDEIKVNPNLTFTIGLRIDRPIYNEQPLNNPAFAALTFQDLDHNPTKYNTLYPKSSWYWSPRAGFRWDVAGDKSMILRGGTGLFTGRIPFVFLTNISSNNFMYQATATVFNTAANPTATSGYLFNPNPDAYTSTFPTTAGAAIINNSAFVSTNPDFKFPQVWRTNLGIDRSLGNGFVVTGELIYTKSVHDVFMFNANLPAPNGALAGSPDTRPRYIGSNKINANIGSNIVLGNTNKGGSFSATIALNKAFTKGLYGSIAYTYATGTDVTANPGSQATSVWNSNPTRTYANAIETAVSSFAMPHRVIAALSYRIEYASHAATTLSLLYEGINDGRFSYTTSADLNNDGDGFDLIYIPKTSADINFQATTIAGVTYSPADQWGIVDAFIKNDNYLSKHRGQYAERNGALVPWFNKVDARLLQDFFVGVNGRRHTLQLSLDVLNLPNLINNSWGIHKSITLRNLLIPSGTFTAGGAPIYRINTFNNAPA